MRDFLKTRVEQLRKPFQRVRARDVAGPVALAFVQSANFAHFVIRELAARISFPRLTERLWNQWAAFLCDRIAIVVALRAKKKMVWPDTRRIVAVMQNLYAFWNWTMVQFPREAMGAHALVWALRHTELPVSEIGFVFCNPKPTRVCFLDLTPEPLFECVGHGRGRF